MTTIVRQSTAALLVLASVLAGCATEAEEPDELGIFEADAPPEGFVRVAELSEEDFLAQLATDEVTEVPLDAAGFSVHSCTVGAYAPFGHASNLHGKGYLSCAQPLGLTYEVRAKLELWYGGYIYEAGYGYAVCVTSGVGCTADYYTNSWAPHYYRTRIQIVFQGGGLVRSAYTGFVWRQP